MIGEKPFFLTDRDPNVTAAVAFGLGVVDTWVYRCPQNKKVILRTGMPVCIKLYDSALAEYAMPGAFVGLEIRDSSQNNKKALFYLQNYTLSSEFQDRRSKYYLRTESGKNWVVNPSDLIVITSKELTLGLSAASLAQSYFSIECAQVVLAGVGK